ncbi:bifunctional proline dehydrogenase/L-glutamate gamma-semialdehyde dehydrogenase [Actinomycetospora termitidis]|uniref:L-glutamate gamma-semialdehyde dehydrogenase n=1 Tax=Actinomycetospora termitidis TaxID=3053470 RepID=A0ABT7M9F7_9PSEU|nr:bifunctional proline dehydrogenase/L-glutamate gamma-semialdehyde dehydrogenase [Actinomycetospora sp. Odt1-22]MDL5157248.1 bifunctional proline dehydrogenase/L-glutamate gamma-semialdehyde dehydrogenase [Actinomycetospora sp. Odt1-22]
MSEQVVLGSPVIDDAMVGRAEARAARWSAASDDAGHDAATRRLASLVHDPAGVDFAMHFVDRVARPEDDTVAARELARIAGRGATLPGFASALDRLMLRAGAALAARAPRLVVPLARRRLQQLVGHLVVDASGRALRRRLAAARADGFRLNLNLLGEAVLGEDEADRRLARTLDLIRRDDVDYVSVKASSVASQLVPWDLEGSRDRLVRRLTPLFETARDHGVFVNLDMEEYKDLDLTVALFTALLDQPSLRGYSAGIVLQAYLPDSVAALEHLAAFARRRVDAGGAPVKVRLVKGANLAMEGVDAALHGWPQAPYATKAEVDANYVRLLDRALRPELADALRIGVASHHLHHVALAVELAAARGVSAQMDVEMLQGMAPAQARAVAADLPESGLVLYTPVVHAEDFDAAVSYLVRRLEENAGHENYLYAMFSDDGPASYLGRFRASVAEHDAVADSPRRTQDRSTEVPVVGTAFRNEPDTDPSLGANRDWARRAVGAAPAVVGAPELTDPADVDAVVDRAAASTWRDVPPAERARLLRGAARSLAVARTDLLTTMVHEAGKTVAEADPEISEAVDFAAYYADRALELDPERFTPARVVVVTPPWNFPVAIPLGGCLAALTAGAAVVIKPAPQVRACAEVGVAALHAAGIPADALQLVHTDEGDAGRRLVTHPDVERVVLTGASETAALFRSWRPDLAVVAETSGKNALVITPAADPDLAVADLVRSAFGHAGQKCSAASLAILVGSVADPRSKVGRRFRRQLLDAVRTLRVGPGTDLSSTMGPLVGELSPKLERALTTLEPGESWLVEPRRVEVGTWTPGVREGVAPGSWFHLTECFGPVLGLMSATTLDEAIELQNATGYGLTGGLHSLDRDEVEHWMERVEVGNAYVNRHITGAIVQRQSFGGWKGSVVGPGAKPGGPNYVAQFGTWADVAMPESAPLGRAASGLLASVASAVPAEDLAWLRAAAGSDAYWWREEFGVEHDPTGIAAEANVFRYRPLPGLRVVVGDGAADRDVVRLRLAGACAGVPVADVTPEVVPAPGERLRVVGAATDALRRRAAEVGASLVEGPVLADGRREMLTVLREQAVSITRHRFGHVEA